MSAATVRVMSARFASTCGACSGRIAAGESIRYVKGFLANHEQCGDPTEISFSSRTRGTRSSYGVGRPGSWSSRMVPSGRSSYVRCTHEDYPCCGCGQ